VDRDELIGWLAEQYGVNPHMFRVMDNGALAEAVRAFVEHKPAIPENNG
jgi:hypothetical protein